MIPLLDLAEISGKGLVPPANHGTSTPKNTELNQLIEVNQIDEPIYAKDALKIDWPRELHPVLKTSDYI